MTTLFICVWVIGFFSIGWGVPWVDPSLQKLDELNDAEIYEAVVRSMNDWQRKQDLKKALGNRTKREEITSACYPDLGCFEASGPFGYLDMLPGKPEEISTRFLLYPGRNRRRSGSPPAEVPFEKIDDAFVWAEQGFNSSLPTKVLIHGFGSDCSYIWVYEIRSALMAVEEVNIICVDWSNGATLPNYVKASANTRLVGKQLSLLLRGFVENNGLSLRNTHIIGFSLGAHIAGFAGADLGNLSRITGLDPAGPLFESQDPRARLDQTDAAFVDVIHSNGENLILGGLGSSQPMGHVDFYPNGGRMQKGCSHLFVGAVSDIIWSSAVEGRSLCNHRRAYKFFIDSVSPRCHFPAFPCDSYEDFLAGKCFPCTDQRTCGNMGYYADRSKGRGQLYLITRDEEPFCAHQYNVKIETSTPPIPIKSYGKIQITLIGESLLNETFMMTRKEDQEMKLGESISRILVPHPILSQPSKVEILYTAYSGWLSSGLTQWSLDKVTLMDSFGKMLSVCQKALVLQSGVPITLPLYPGECNLPKEIFEEAEDRVQQVESLMENRNSSNATERKESFVPTQVVRIGLDGEEHKNKQDSSAVPADIFNIPWKNEKENNIIDSEAESSRAFNTRVIKTGRNKSPASDGLREIVEPILKPHSNKNARSHDPDKDNKVEITEPILGPTTAKNSGIVSSTSVTKESVDASRNKSDWVPKDIPISGKKKREDESKVMTGFESTKQEGNNPLDAIVTTVQFLPQRLARMFEQAEKYARDNILPLVSTYTPKFITDIITPKETKPRYVPLIFDEPIEEVLKSETRSLKRNEYGGPPATEKFIESTDKESKELGSENFRKVRRKGDTASSVTETATDISSVSVSSTSERGRSNKAKTANSQNRREPSRITRDDLNVRPEQREKSTGDPFDALLSTVQLLPRNIGKMFAQAEKFTRENIVPFVNNITPKFITDIIAPQPNLSEIRYIPLEDISPPSQVEKSKSNDNEDFATEEDFEDAVKVSKALRRIRENKSFNPPPMLLELALLDNDKGEKTTPRTNIQKIRKKSDTRRNGKKAKRN